MDIDKVAGSASAQEEGVWVDYLGTDWRFKVRYARSKKARQWIRNATHKASRKLRNPQDMPPEVSDKITMDWLANYIIQGWSGITSSGKALPFSAEACAVLLEKVPDVADFISNAAQDITNFGGEVGSVEGSAAQAELKSVPAVAA